MDAGRAVERGQRLGGMIEPSIDNLKVPVLAEQPTGFSGGAQQRDHGATVSKQAPDHGTANPADRSDHGNCQPCRSLRSRQLS